jgi:DNA-binding MarR family transcriptional regulator
MQHTTSIEISDTDLTRFRKFLRALERSIAGQLKDETVCCGITSAQCHTILELEERGKASVSELADSFGLDRSTLSRTIDGLVTGGLLSRVENQEDRRYSLITLTEEGKKKVTWVNDLCNSDYRRLFSFIPREKHTMVIEAAEILADAMGQLRKTETCCVEEK